MRRERGFSLVELMVALVMTLIVSGAIYGLMASGQGSFKREPALIDRQQNIRVAMDMLTRDIENAGAGLSGFIVPANPDPGPPPLTQIFTPALNNFPNTGPLPIQSAILGGGLLADALEMLVVDGSCPTLRVCDNTSTATDLYLYPTALPTNGCMGFGVAPAETGPVSFYAYLSAPNAAGTKSTAVVSNSTPGMLWVTSAAAASVGCGTGAAAARAHLVIPAGQTPSNPCAGGACQSLTPVSRVRYELAGEIPENAASFGRGTVAPWTGNPPLNPPCLWRSDIGRRNRDGTPNTGPYSGGGANNPWQMVARGIDDLQIDYQTAVEFLGAAPDTTWLTVPPTLGNPPITAAPVNTDQVVRRVRVRLSARAIPTGAAGAGALGGETTYPGNAAAEPGRRGQLTTIVTPRAALKTIAMDSNAARNWR